MVNSAADAFTEIIKGAAIGAVTGAVSGAVDAGAKVSGISDKVKTAAAGKSKSPVPSKKTAAANKKKTGK